MAKDGTIRGGKRVGSGRKKEIDSERALVEGDAIPEYNQSEDTRRKAPSYLSRGQKCGITLTSKKIYRDTFAFLEKIKCDKLVNPKLVEQYAMAAGRWQQCEEMASREGLTGCHPTTGATIASPYVTMAQNYAKQATVAWAQIQQIIQASGATTESIPDDPMEALLS